MNNKKLQEIKRKFEREGRTAIAQKLFDSLISTIEAQSKELNDIREMTWCKRNEPGPESAIYRMACKGLGVEE